MDKTFKETVSQLLSLVDVVCYEVLIGIWLTPDGQMIWATNGMNLKEKLLTDGLRFGEADDFFEHFEVKDENISGNNVSSEKTGLEVFSDRG